MKNSTKTTLRLISVVAVLALVLMQLNIIPDLVKHDFWFLVAAYGLALITFR